MIEIKHLSKITRSACSERCGMPRSTRWRYIRHRTIGYGEKYFSQMSEPTGASWRRWNHSWREKHSGQEGGHHEALRKRMEWYSRVSTCSNNIRYRQLADRSDKVASPYTCRSQRTSHESVGMWVYQQIQCLPEQLSGGQKQRGDSQMPVYESRNNIVRRTDIGSDPYHGKRGSGVIHNLAEKGMTMVIVTHEMNFAHDVSNRVFYMDQVRYMSRVPPDEIFDSPETELTKTVYQQGAYIPNMTYNEGCDLYDMLGQIGEFAKRIISRKSWPTTCCIRGGRDPRTCSTVT